MKQSRAQIIAIALSFGLHLLFASALVFGPGFERPRSRAKTPTEVELIDPATLKALQNHRQDQPSGQIVNQSPVRVNDDIPVDSHFLSQFNQTVVHQTQAANHGKFKNSKSLSQQLNQPNQTSAQALKQMPRPKPELNKLNKEEAELSKQADRLNPNFKGERGDVALRKRPIKDLMPSFSSNLNALAQDSGRAEGAAGGDGPSATDDHLKNIPTGMQTLLSTREFVYYSYYNRIKDKLRQYWEPMIKEKMERVLRQGRTLASSDNKITRIVILLDERGTLVRVQVLSASGVRDLDDAAIEAFRAAAPFPNPPKGIVEPDGFIRIRWDFVLEA
jgi:protein TonB